MNMVNVFVFGGLACSLRNPAPAPAVEEAPAQDVDGSQGSSGDGAEAPSTDVSALIEGTVALEVQHHRRKMGASRDAALIASVQQIVSAGTVQQAGGMPRCLPAVWVRFVPPDAEGGLTALFCNREGPAYFWTPEQGVVVLDPASSLQLHDALADPAPFTGPALLPVAVEQSASLEVTFHVHQDEGAAPMLRSLTFVTEGARTEPDMAAPDGAALTRAVVVSDEAAEALARELLSAGFFARAERYYSPLSEAPEGAPPAGEAGPPPAASSDAPGQVTVTVVSDGWHRTWSEVQGAAIFAHLVSAVQLGEVVGEHQAALDAMSAAIQP
jgi:hypothetical protein